MKQNLTPIQQKMNNNLRVMLRERMQEPQMVETRNQVTPATTTTATPPTMNPGSPGQSSGTSWQVTEDMNPNALDPGY